MPLKNKHAQSIPTPTNQKEEDKVIYRRQTIKKVVEFDKLSPEGQRALEEDYYKAYDVNDGIRTAAALGGLITLFMVFIIYKTKCKAKKKYLSISENLPFDEFTSKDGRTSQDVSNIFSNTSSMKGSNLLLHPLEGFQSPTCGSQAIRTPNVSQSSYDGVSNNNVELECSAGFSGASRDQFRVLSPTDSWVKCDEFRRSDRSKRSNANTLLQEANINIQVIQPTPNITPRGSLRIESPDDPSSVDDASNLRMIIPLLTPLKTSTVSHQVLQHRVSFDGQSVGSDTVFLEEENCEMTYVKRRKDRRTGSGSSTRSSRKKRKSNEETSC